MQIFRPTVFHIFGNLIVIKIFVSPVYYRHGQRVVEDNNLSDIL